MVCRPAGLPEDYPFGDEPDDGKPTQNGFPPVSEACSLPDYLLARTTAPATPFALLWAVVILGVASFVVGLLAGVVTAGFRFAVWALRL